MATIKIPALKKILVVNDGSSLIIETKKEFDEYLRIYAIDDPTTKPLVAPINFLKVYKNNINSLLLPSIPWAEILPESFIENYLSNLKKWWLEQKFPTDPTEFYNSFQAENILVNNLVSLTIDPKLFQKYFSETAKKESFSLFDPENIIPIKYNRNTTTGRMTVSSGPNLLVLPKNQRNMIKAKNGCLLYADFKSLEPNTLLFVTGKNPTETFYEDLTKIINCDRSTIKLGYLATIYGAGVEKVAEIFSVTKYKAQEISEKFNFYLGIEILREELITKWYKNEKKFIENYFGQRIRTPHETPEYKLLSLYLQSTATEMSIRMFAKATELLIKSNLSSRFSGIIHDGGYIDCLSSETVQVKNILKNVGSLFDPKRPFPITIE